MIKPLGKNVTATIVEANKISAGGIYLGDATAQSLAPKIAEIVAVGDEITKVKVGDQVVFKPYATYEVKEDKTDFVMLEEDDILGIIEPEPTPKK